MLSVHALTTIEALRAEMGLPPEDTSQDSMLARYINAASDAIRAYCGRDFSRAHGTDIVRGSGRHEQLVRLYPIIEVHQVLIYGQPVTDYRVDAANGMLWRDSIWPRAKTPNVNIEYTGGYVTPQQSADDNELTRDLPYDVEEACLVTAATWMSRQGTPRDATVLQAEQIRVQFSSVQGGSAESLLPVAVQRLLGPHRRWA